MKKVLFSLTLCTMAFTVNAQVLIDDTGTSDFTPDPSAVLELRSDIGGLLLPRLAQAPSNAVEGLLYYDTTESCFKGYNGTTWDAIGAACTAATTTAYTVSIADATNVVEGADQTFTVSISPAVASGDVVTVEYVTSEINPISATEDTDYAGDIGTLTFNATNTTQTITIATTDDTDVESNESYTVELSNVAATGNATASLGTSTATGVIEDNDGAVSTGFIQDFDSSSTWTYTLSTPLCNNGGDIWDIVASIGGITMNNNFFAVQDLTGNCGSANGETIKFDTVNITNETSISFDYNIFEFDNGDDVKYTATFDGIIQQPVVLVNGNSNTSLDGTVTINIPSGTTSVSLDLFVDQNGGSDNAGFDNFKVQ